MCVHFERASVIRAGLWVSVPNAGRAAQVRMQTQ